MKKSKLISWLVVGAWMVVIYLFSAQTGDRSGSTSGSILRFVVKLVYWNFAELPPVRQGEILEFWHLLVRKGAHFTEYAVLGLLICNALRGRFLLKGWRWVIPIGISALYAVTDEIHQYFIPERACRFLDVCIDTAGAAFGTVVFGVVLFCIREYKKRETK